MLGPFRNAAIWCAAPGKRGLGNLRARFPSTLYLMKGCELWEKINEEKHENLSGKMGNNQNTLCSKMLQFLFLISEEKGFIKQRIGTVRLHIVFGSSDVSAPCYLQQSQRQTVAHGSWALEHLTQKMTMLSKTLWQVAGLISDLLLPCDET